MNVKWEHVCYTCRCPLNIYVETKFDRKILNRLINFYNLRPIDFSMNTPMFKFFGLKVRRVCVGCYYCKPIIDIRKRECGLPGATKKHRLSKSFKEVYEWFESCSRFLWRSDAEEYFPEKLDYKRIPGILFANIRS